mmetsp:Transcript_12699/g.24417  ORF Transcript_12699/g.24417 Transcript_12699/m.24417 type:complete len:84 (-) Transcript_12699:166-417(-)|eukprot:scaffold1650_cov163-Amphora_coffeaeformis.AAC.5
MKQSSYSTPVPTLRRSFVRPTVRGDRRSAVPPEHSILVGIQSERDHMSRQDVVAIIEAALLLTSSFDFPDEDEDEDKSSFNSQ